MHKYQIQSNNLDFLRLILASLVVIWHLSELTQNASIEKFASTFEFAASKAVPGFFIISGFLIYMSFEKSTSLGGYFWNRFLRIYPAYILLLVSCSLLFFFISSYTLEDYFGLDFVKYFFYNLIFLNFIQPMLPGVFQDHVITVVNGSLWTLKIEILFYLAVPLVYGLIKLIGPLKVIFFIYIASIVYFEFFEYLYLISSIHLYHSLAMQLPGQMAYFICGVVAYLYFGVIKEKIKYLLPLAVGIFIFEFRYLEPVALMLVLIYFFMICKYTVNLRKIGDISYGVYIYHFPIIQIFISLSILDQNPLGLIVLTYFTTYLVAYGSWVLIEKRSLKLKNFKLR